MALGGAVRFVGSAGILGPRAALAALVFTSAAWTVATAQVATPRPATATSEEPKQDTGQLEQITVTARYTQENLQTTPVAITAVTGDQLQERHIENVTDLGKVVPNLFITP